MAAYKRRRSISRARPYKRRRLYKKNRRIAKRAARRIKYRLSSLRDTKRAFGFGERKIVNCRWVGIESFTCPTSQLVATNFTSVRLNNAYDPWTGLTGNYNVQAAGFKLYATMYKSYVVLGAKLITTFRPITTLSQDKPFKVGLRKLNEGGTTMPTSYSQWYHHATDPDSVSKNLIMSNKRNTACRVVMTYSPRKEFNVKNVGDAASSSYGISAYTNSGPSHAVNCIPWLQSTDGDCTATTFWQIEHLLLMRIMFFDRNELMSLAPDNSMVEGDT